MITVAKIQHLVFITEMNGTGLGYLQSMTEEIIASIHTEIIMKGGRLQMIKGKIDFTGIGAETIQVITMKYGTCISGVHTMIHVAGAIMKVSSVISTVKATYS